MKKVLNYLFLLFIILVPIKSVKADMAAPSDYNLKASCNNIEGCYIYSDYRFKNAVAKVEYEATVEVDYYDDEFMDVIVEDYEFLGKTSNPYSDCDGDYGCIEEEIEEDETEGLEGYVKLDDFYILNKAEVGISDKGITKLSKSVKMKITDKEGTTIHTGPNSEFKYIGQVPYGFEYDVEYGYMGYGDEFAGKDHPTWAYISYKGVSGWVSVYMHGVYKLDTPLKYKTYEKTKLNSSTYIPINTELDVNYKFMNSLLVEYNGEEGTLTSGYLASSTTEVLKTKNQVTIYSNVKKSKSVVKIPKGTMLYPTFSADIDRTSRWYYVTYNGKKGWLENPYGSSSIKVYYEGDKNYPGRPTEVEKKEEIKTPEKTTDNKKEESKEESNVVTPIDSKSNKADVEPKDAKSFELKGINLVIFCVALSIIVAVITAIVVLKIGKKND